MHVDQICLAAGDLIAERLKHCGCRGIGFPFDDLVAEDQMVTELGGRQRCQQPVVLVGVAALRSEIQLGARLTSKGR